LGFGTLSSTIVPFGGSFLFVRLTISGSSWLEGVAFGFRLRLGISNDIMKERQLCHVISLVLLSHRIWCYYLICTSDRVTVVGERSSTCSMLFHNELAEKQV
jgi:hypothetical protein